MQVFARKIIRSIGQISRADIENEARVISLFMGIGGHKNIVTITQHGWMKAPSFNYYYIDMELCDFTLETYITHLDGSKAIGKDEFAHCPPVFIQQVPHPVIRIQNAWTIGVHIARGLEFMHSQERVHRDLNPSNGTDVQ